RRGGATADGDAVHLRGPGGSIFAIVRIAVRTAKAGRMRIVSAQRILQARSASKGETPALAGAAGLLRSAPIRISFVIDSLSRAGTESQLVALIRLLDRKQFEPSLV